MNRKNFISAMALAVFGLALAGAVAAPRTQLLREGWRFADDLKHDGVARGWATNFPSAAQPAPMPFAGALLMRGCSSAWLAKDFAADLKVAPGDHVYLVLGGVNYRCRAYLNGRFLGRHDGSCGSFEWEVTDALKLGASNRLVLNVETCATDGTLDGLRRDQLPILGMTGGGTLVQEVPKLVVRPAAHLTDVFVRTDPETGVATVRATARNVGKDAAKLPLKVKIAISGDDAALDEAETAVELRPGATGAFTANVRVADVRLWSVDDPRLYRVTVALGDDVRTLRVGYRTLRVDDEGYFTLNGKRIFIKCCHTLTAFPDAPSANLNTERMRKQLLYFKACGFNAIRYLLSTSYPETMDLCDEIGLMVYEEHVYSWLRKSSDRTDEFMVDTCRSVLERDRNHASFTLFGMLNETETTKEKTAIVDAADKALATLRPLAPDVLFLFQSGRWDGQLGRASASNPGSLKWDAWMGNEGPDRDMKPHPYGCDGVGDVHYYPSHPVEAEINRRALERPFNYRRAAFLSEAGAGSQVNMVAAYLKFDMEGWARTASEYDCMKEHALGFRKFFDEWRLYTIWPTPEEFVADTQDYQSRQRRLLTAFARRNPHISGYSITMGMDKDFRGEGLTEGDGTFKRGATKMLEDCCSDLMFCIFAHDSCVFASAGADVEVALSDFNVLKPDVKYPIRLRVTSAQGVVWERKLDFSVQRDAKGHTPTGSKVFSGHLDMKGWPTGDYVLSAEFLEGAYATCGTKTLHVVADDEVRNLLKGRTVALVGTNRTACAAIVAAAGGTAATAEAAELKEGDTAFVMPGPLDDAEAQTLLSAAECGARVVFADAASLAGKDGRLRLPFAKDARIHKEWNWLYHYDAFVYASPLTAGVKNRMICDTEYFGALWSDRCVCGLQPPDEPAFACVYLGIDGAATKKFFHGLQLGGYPLGKGRVILNTLKLAADDPVALRVFANALGALPGGQR